MCCTWFAHDWARATWRQFVAQWGDYQNFKWCLSIRLLLLLLLLRSPGRLWLGIHKERGRREDKGTHDILKGSCGRNPDKHSLLEGQAKKQPRGESPDRALSMAYAPSGAKHMSRAEECECMTTDTESSPQTVYWSLAAVGSAAAGHPSPLVSLPAPVLSYHARFCSAHRSTSRYTFWYTDHIFFLIHTQTSAWGQIQRYFCMKSVASPWMNMSVLLNFFVRILG